MTLFVGPGDSIKVKALSINVHLLRGPKDKVRIMETHWASGRGGGEKDPQELPTCLSLPLFPVSLPMAGTASSPGRRQQAELGSSHPSPAPKPRASLAGGTCESCSAAERGACFAKT